MCPTLQDGLNAQVYAVGGFPNPPQMRYDSYSNMYTQEWRDNLSFNYAARPPNFQQQYQQQQPTFESGISLEEIVKSLATNIQQFQQETRMSI